MTDNRVSQGHVEALYTGVPPVRVSQDHMEALYTGVPPIAVAQGHVEVLISPETFGPTVRYWDQASGTLKAATIRGYRDTASGTVKAVVVRGYVEGGVVKPLK